MREDIEEASGQEAARPPSNLKAVGPVAAVSVLPLWASIVVTLASPVVALVALVLGKRQQTATLSQQRTEHKDALGEQRRQFTETVSLQRTQFEATQKDATGAMAAQFAYDRDQRKLTFDHENRLEDLKEIRSVLDDAARRLHRADSARRALVQDTRNADKKSTLGQAGTELDELQQRIAIRFG